MAKTPKGLSLLRGGATRSGVIRVTDSFALTVLEAVSDTLSEEQSTQRRHANPEAYPYGAARGTFLLTGNFAFHRSMDECHNHF